MSINLPDHEATNLQAALDTISLLATFMILSLPSNPSQRIIELALARIQDACEAVKPITSKFEA